MKRFRSIWISWLLVIAVVTRPTPAQAFVPLAPVAVGAMIVAAGVLVAGAALYKPATFSATDQAVDAVTGDITRKCIVGRAIGTGLYNAAQQIYGTPGQYTLDFAKACDWIASHTPDFPTLSPAFQQTYTQIPLPAPVAGDVVAIGTTHYKIVKLALGPYNYGSLYTTTPSQTPYETLHNNWPTWTEFGGQRIGSFGSGRIQFLYGPYFSGVVDANGNKEVRYYSAAYDVTTTTDLVYPVPQTGRDPSKLAAAIPQTQGAQDESDKIAADNPGAVKTPPVAITPEQLQAAIKDAAATAADAAARAAIQAASADPMNSTLAAAADQAKAAADAAKLAAEEEKAKDEVKKEDVPPASLAPAPAVPQLDFSPLYALKDAVSSHYPFCWLSSLAGYFQPLVSDPVAPRFEFPNGFGGQMVADLSGLNSIASAWRAALLFFFNATCIYAILRRWS